MNAPTVEEIQAVTQVPELRDLTEAQAAARIAFANAAFSNVTWRAFADRPIAAVETEPVPGGYEPLVLEVVRGLAESSALDATEDTVATLSDFALIASFSAGPYSETRRSLDEMYKARMVHPWPWVNALLWDLMTEDRMEAWLFFFDPSRTPPAFETTEVDWRHELFPDDLALLRGSGQDIVHGSLPPSWPRGGGPWGW